MYRSHFCGVVCSWFKTLTVFIFIPDNKQPETSNFIRTGPTSSLFSGPDWFISLNWATDSACGGRVFRVHRIVPSFFSKAADWSGLSKCWEMFDTDRGTPNFRRTLTQGTGNLLFILKVTIMSLLCSIGWTEETKWKGEVMLLSPLTLYDIRVNSPMCG